ncbi:class C sortase [Lysinibacter cavernae]|uniref:Sortase A n=1 Tax=Lysinibacter cavernae TaxID=1640652 RepID=A0A7X5R1Q9_9MICO|nr:class C sortase [Lysinibacter cavernae]NIH53765.1 sortase A [Lysinibacter cavernae]
MRSPKHASRPRQRGYRWQRFAVLIAACMGVSIMLYPMAATWLTERAHGSALNAYASQVDSAEDSTKQDLLTAADDYNKALPQGVLRDPYRSESGAQAADSADDDNYLSQLRLPGSEVMGRLSIPSINVELPLYHGTSEQTLDLGAGHLLGSSLPVGGIGTHSVLTAHSGLPNAEMLSGLGNVRKGDTFSLSVLDRDLFYRVDQITVVTPDNLEDLTITRGHDYVTLITCTPLNVNSHRLLVRGERIDAPSVDSQMVSAVDTARFPWWIIIFVAALGTVTAVLFAPANLRKRRQNASPSNERSATERE